MQDTLKMKRTITEYDEDGNLVYSKTEYFSDNDECGKDIPDIKVTFRTDVESDGACDKCDSCPEDDQTEEEIMNELNKQLDQILNKIGIMRVVRTVARCALYAAASFTAAKVVMKLKER